MATVAQQRQPTSAQSRPHHEASRSASASPANMAPAQHNPAPAPAPAKKGKGKKATDPSEQQKQIQAKIAQLELDQAGDKEQELEIGASTSCDGAVEEGILWVAQPMSAQHETGALSNESLADVWHGQNAKLRKQTANSPRSSPTWTARCPGSKSCRNDIPNSSPI